MICGNAGCDQIFFGLLVSVLIIFYILPVGLYKVRRALRRSAVKDYVKSGGESNGHMRGLMGEFYEEGDEKDWNYRWRE